VTGIILIIGRGTVTVHVVTKILTAESHLTITAHTESVAFRMLHHTVASVHLRPCRAKRSEKRKVKSEKY
jgi:hypothetical protein